MKLVPPYVAPSCQSDGERKVFAALEDARSVPGARAFHSLNVPLIHGKHEGEIDFLIVTPDGYLVLEVKGGGVRVDDGSWTYMDRYGKRHPGGEGPFRQAQRAMYALRDRLEDQIGPEVRSLVHGYGVVFPDCTFDVASEEWVPEMVIDQRNIDQMDQCLNDLFAHWKAKRHSRGLPSRPVVDRVVEFVRPDFEKLPGIGTWASDLIRESHELTEQQLGMLDLVETSDRLVVEGGAGTGKTFMAIEIARRHARAGELTLLMCHSKVLSAFLKAEAREENLEVMTLDTAREIGDVFDALVVDEGQDLINYEALSTVDSLVHGGLEKGRWRIFLDPNHQAGVSGRFDPAAYGELRAYATVNTPPLKRNVRNTRQIVDNTRLLTGADVGEPPAGHGPDVQIVDCNGDADATAQLAEWLDRLGDDGVVPGRITVVSPVDRNRSIVHRLPRTLATRIVSVSSASVAGWPPRETTFSEIGDVKGLENEFIALVDVDEALLSEAQRGRLYVSITRARVQLAVFLDRTLRGRYEQLMTSHGEAIPS